MLLFYHQFGLPFLSTNFSQFEQLKFVISLELWNSSTCISSVLSLDITEMRNRLWCATTHSLIKLFTVERWGHDIDKVGSFSILFSGQQQSLGPIKDAVWDHVLYYWYVLLHYPSASKLHATCIIVAVGSSQIIERFIPVSFFVSDEKQKKSAVLSLPENDSWFW